MPVTVRKGSGAKPYKIVEKATGKVVGSSTTREKAQSSANARNAARHGWKPTGKSRKKQMNKDDLTTKELKSIMVSDKERSLIKLLRDTKYGRVVVYLESGQPVRVEEVTKSIKL